MAEKDARRAAARYRKQRDAGHGWVRYLIAMLVMVLVGGMALVPDVSLLIREHTLAAGPTPPAAPFVVSPFTASSPYIIGGLDPPPTPTPLPTDTPSPPTVTPQPQPTLPPTATPVPPTATPSGPTPTPDQGAPGAAAFVNGTVSVPVLMYHYIRVNPNRSDATGFGLSVTPTDFAAQMDWIVANGYHTVLPTDLRHALVDGTPLPTKPIVLTFDDGYRDFYNEAWPVLQRYGLKASVAIITAYADKGDIGDEQYMNWDMIRTLDVSGMVEIASHTVFHADLTHATTVQRMTELSQSKTTLEAKLSHSCQTFVYPSGLFNTAVVNDADRAGYAIAFTTQSGKVRTPLDNGRMLTLPRLRVSGGETLATLTKEISG